jgi:TrmH family RNA methyltransferase
VDGVILTSGSVDAFSPKVLRAGMGAHFRLPLAVQSPAELIGFCQERGLALWASLVDNGTPHTQADLTAPLAVVVGSEAHGVGPEIRTVAKPIRIAMPGGGESLNAAAAGAVLLFEIQRQRIQ